MSRVAKVIEIGLVLFIVTFAINAASRLLIWGMTHQKKQKAAVPLKVVAEQAS